MPVCLRSFSFSVRWRASGHSCTPAHQPVAWLVERQREDRGFLPLMTALCWLRREWQCTLHLACFISNAQLSRYVHLRDHLSSAERHVAAAHKMHAAHRRVST
jgi:hypothetical protein